MEAMSAWIVPMWLLPAVLFVMAPLAILSVWLICKGEAVLFAAVFGIGDRRPDYTEKRLYRRINTNELGVKVTSGAQAKDGLVCNISRRGISFMGLPMAVEKRLRGLVIVVEADDGSSYSLHVTPRWHKRLESGRQIGASIDEVPAGWHDFVRKRGSFAAL